MHSRDQSICFKDSMLSIWFYPSQPRKTALPLLPHSTRAHLKIKTGLRSPPSIRSPTLRCYIASFVKIACEGTRGPLQHAFKGIQDKKPEIAKLEIAAIIEILQGTINTIRSPMEMVSGTALSMMLCMVPHLKNMEEAVRKNRCESQKFGMEEMMSSLDTTKKYLLLIMEKLGPVPSWL